MSNPSIRGPIFLTKFSAVLKSLFFIYRFISLFKAVLDISTLSGIFTPPKSLILVAQNSTNFDGLQNLIIAFANEF